MTKLIDLSLEDLYTRKITSTVERVIMSKEDFTKRAPNWCATVCKLKCKNPPEDNLIAPSEQTDILLIEDYKAFADNKYNRDAARIQKAYIAIIRDLCGKMFTGLRVDLTSLLKCSLRDDDVAKNKAPTDTYIMKCRPYLLTEIQRRKPKVIISLATSVTKSLGFKKGNYGDRGQVLDYLGIPVILTLHPRILTMLRQNSSGAFWGPDFYSIIQRDFQKARDIANGTLTIPSTDVGIENAKKSITIARSIEDVKRLTKHIIELGRQRRIISFDTETTGLDPYDEKAKLISVQFGWKNDEGKYEAAVFPMWHKDNIWYNPDEAWEFIHPILTDVGITKVGHNLKFDILYVAGTTGIRIAGVVYDTMLLLHSINSGIQGNYGLKQAVHDWLPETGLGGYEDKLPKLTKEKKLEEEENDDDEETT